MCMRRHVTRISKIGIVKQDRPSSSRTRDRLRDAAPRLLPRLVYRASCLSLALHAPRLLSHKISTSSRPVSPWLPPGPPAWGCTAAWQPPACRSPSGGPAASCPDRRPRHPKPILAPRTASLSAATLPLSDEWPLTQRKYVLAPALVLSSILSSKTRIMS